MKLYRLLVPALLLSVGACDKSSPGPTANPDTTGDGSATGASDDSGGEAELEPGAPSIAWADKTFKQRQEFMGVFFLPAMKKAFKGYNESQFSGFKCQNCHGDDMNDRKYAMPSDSIYPLNADKPIESAMDYDPEITKFMNEWVVPEGAKLLGEEPWDPKTKGPGFGCFSCHPKE